MNYHNITKERQKKYIYLCCLRQFKVATFGIACQKSGAHKRFPDDGTNSDVSSSSSASVVVSCGWCVS